MNIGKWYEVRVDGEKVAAFAGCENRTMILNKESLKEARNIVEVTRNGLYKDGELQIVEQGD